MSLRTLISENNTSLWDTFQRYKIYFRFCNQPSGSSDAVSCPGHLLAVIGANGFPDTFCRWVHPATQWYSCLNNGVLLKGMKLLFSNVFFFMFPGSTPTHTSSSNSSDKERDRVLGKKRLSSAKFQPPDRPPAYKDWVPDSKHHVCMVCRREKFSMVRDYF